MARQKMFKTRHERQVVQAQRFVRGWLARKRFLTVRRGIILLQSHFRRRKAKAEFRQLKARDCCLFYLYCTLTLFVSPRIKEFLFAQIEARSTEGLKKVNVGLENKIIELQQRLDERVRCSLFLLLPIPISLRTCFKLYCTVYST